MPVLIARHGERIDFVDSAWVDSAERPFDPPLTACGVAQGTALGVRLRDLTPRVSKVFVSPLGRTVQTADAAVAALGVDVPLYIEPGLVEVLDPGWYRCWRCSATDARAGVNAATLLMTAEQLRDTVSARVDPSYAPVFDVHALQITRKNAERWSAMTARLDETVRKLAAAHPDESILLVTHGGPIEAVCPALDPRVDRHAEVKYTCLSAFHADAAAPQGFTCTLHACAEHAGL